VVRRTGKATRRGLVANYSERTKGEETYNVYRDDGPLNFKEEDMTDRKRACDYRSTSTVLFSLNECRLFLFGAR
jgi:hypothetical protein